jgi:hypothetical protein
MSDRFTREKRRPTEWDAAGDLARRARQQMRAAVSTLRAGFTGDVLARPDEPREPEAADDQPRFRSKRP